MMTNAGMQAIISQFGDKVCAFFYGNNNAIYVGYNNPNAPAPTPPTNPYAAVPVKPFPTSPAVTDITFETIGGVDFTVVPQEDATRRTHKFTATVPDPNQRGIKPGDPVRMMTTEVGRNMPPIKYKKYIDTSSIYKVVIIDEEFKDFRPGIESL